MSRSQLSIVFVAGAFHTEVHIQPLAPHVEKSGYRLVPVRLRMTDCIEKDPKFQDNVELVNKVIQDEVDAGYDVCLVGHSVSGQSCAVALNEYLSTATAAQKSQLKHVIFVACFFDNMRLDAEVDWYRVDWNTFASTVPHPEHCFYNDLSLAEAQPFIDALGPYRAHMPPENVLPLWRTEVKTAYFLCLRDKAVSPHLQRLEAVEMEMPVTELDAAHCPSVSRPEELADAIHKVLSEG